MINSSPFRADYDLVASGDSFSCLPCIDVVGLSGCHPQLAPLLHQDVAFPAGPSGPCHQVADPLPLWEEDADGASHVSQHPA